MTHQYIFHYDTYTYVIWTPNKLTKADPDIKNLKHYNKLEIVEIKN